MRSAAFILIVFFAFSYTSGQAQPDSIQFKYPKIGAKIFSGKTLSEEAATQIGCYGAVLSPMIMSVPPLGANLGAPHGYGAFSDTVFHLNWHDFSLVKQEIIYAVKQHRDTKFIAYLMGPKKLELHNYYKYPNSYPRRMLVESVSPKWFAYTILTPLQEAVSANPRDTVFKVTHAAARNMFFAIKNRNIPENAVWLPSNVYEWTYISCKDNDAGAGRGNFEIMAVKRVDTLTNTIIMAQKRENGQPAGRTIFGATMSYSFEDRIGLLASCDSTQGSPAILMNCYYNPADPKYKTEMLADTTDWNSDWLGALTEYTRSIYMKSAYNDTYLCDGVMMDTDNEYWRAHTYHLGDQFSLIGYQLDMNWDGVPDDIDGEVNAWLPEMYHNLLYRIDTAAAALNRPFFVIRNGHIEQFGHTAEYVAGREFEDFGMVSQDDTYADAVAQYIALSDTLNSSYPHITIVAERDREAAGNNEYNFKEHRHIMALTTVLGEGFYTHTGLHATHLYSLQNVGNTGPEDWFDEYAVTTDGLSAKLLPAATGMDTVLNRLNHIGWLGVALGPGYKIDSSWFSFGYAYTFRRDFENGIVLYSQYPHTVTLEGPFKKIEGADPGNDGGVISSIEFDEPRMGIFLRRMNPVINVRHHSEVDDEVAIFPNPATDEVWVNFPVMKEGGTISLLSPEGRHLSKYTLSKGQDTFRMDVGQLPDGLYFISLEGVDGVIIRRFVKISR